jgi:hypothetical protein
VGAMKNETENQLEKPTEEPIEESIEKPIEEVLEKTIEESIETLPEEVAKESTEELAEELINDTIDEPVEKQIKNYRKIAISLGISICTLLIIYFGMVIYFMNHFNFNTKINNISVSAKSVADAKEAMAYNLQDYTLNLKERGGKVEQIKATDIGLKYSLDEEYVKEFKDKQNPFNWILECFNKEKSKMTVGFSYNEELLKKQINNLSFLDENNVIEPKNPSFKYSDNIYTIVDEDPGNKVDKDILYSHIVESILKGRTEIDLESEGCYIKPQYDSKSKKTIEVRDTLNKYVSSKVTYTFENSKETLDGSVINKWLKINERFEVMVDEEKVKNYIDTLSKNYSTVGKTRDFVTSSGKTIKINGGDYGWNIDETKETQNLISAIKEGKNITKEPEYNQTAFSSDKNDIGNTYVEIDITNQHIWFYKKGSLIVQGDIVTGNVKNNNATPKGIYRLKYKASNVVLRGRDYAAPVTFWMPFNGGIGIHDASWRSVFGGNIYKTNGSHGCVNSPYNVAKAIFYNVDVNTPVVCY